ncbi:MAG: oligogalacturonate lyase family protein [Planctomycetota bacterium]
MSNAGRIWKSELSTIKDRVSGLPVRRLTDHLCHSHHLYFTNPGWWDGGRRLLFASDRGNATNLYSVELKSGRITQLTDLAPGAEFLNTSVNPTRAECYFFHRHKLWALDLKRLRLRVLRPTPDGYMPNITNVTADGKYLCTVEVKKPTFATDLLHGYVGFAEMHAARPHCRIVEVAVDGSGTRVLFEENAWIGHINTSPTQANLVSFCHEGPWQNVDCRMWGLDRSTGKVWKIRPTTKNEWVGHEYWLQDGVTLGYHGHARHRGKLQPIFGFIRYDNTQREEAPFGTDSTHFYSNRKDLVVGDGRPNDPYLYLWRYRGGQFGRPRVLCVHRGSFHIQKVHVHPRFSPDGKYVLFTADPDGYGNLYTVAVPEWKRLKEKPER